MPLAELLAQADVVPFADNDIYWLGVFDPDELMMACTVRMVDWLPDA